MKPILALVAIVSPLVAGAQSGSTRVPVDDVRVLLISAIDSPTGQAQGVLTGQMASLITDRFKAAGPILIDVTTERRYRQPGCSRLKLTFSQDGVNLPGASGPERKTVDIGLNYCRDGTPPKSLSRGAPMRTLLIGLAIVFVAHPALSQQQGADTAASSASAAPAGSIFWGDYRRGWHFYEDPEPEVTPPQKLPPRAKEATPESRPPELVEFARLQKRLEDYRNIAIIRPTEANVRRYMELEASVVRQASYFSEVAQRVAWSTPELDMTLQGRPVNARGIEVFDREQAQSRNQSLAALARTHVLFFFFRSDCPYCHAFAPTLEAFQARHGIQIVPISVDGGGLPNFPQYRRDNSISRTLQVTQVPAVFLAEPFTGKITPIGFGVLSESQLIERIATVTAPGADALVPSVTRQVSLK